MGRLRSLLIKNPWLGQDDRVRLVGHGISLKVSGNRRNVGFVATVPFPTVEKHIKEEEPRQIKGKTPVVNETISRFLAEVFRQNVHNVSTHG